MKLRYAAEIEADLVRARDSISGLPGKLADVSGVTAEQPSVRNS